MLRASGCERGRVAGRRGEAEQKESSSLGVVRRSLARGSPPPPPCALPGAPARWLAAAAAGGLLPAGRRLLAARYAAPPPLPVTEAAGARYRASTAELVLQ